MPQVIVYLGKKESEIVDAYCSENKLTKADAIIDMINQFESEEEEQDG